MIKLFIYKLTNIKNNKIYIGQTDNLRKRKSSHKSYGKNLINNTYITKAIHKHGWENFIFEEVESVNGQELADEREIYWITFYKSRDKRFGYNLAEGGSVNRGWKITEETRAKLRGRDPWNRGVPMSEEQKQLVSQSRKGKMVGLQNHNFGKHIPARNKLPIICINSGVWYPSLTEAARSVNKTTGKMNSACLAKSGVTVAGYIWRYVDDVLIIDNETQKEINYLSLDKYLSWSDTCSVCFRNPNQKKIKSNIILSSVLELKNETNPRQSKKYADYPFR
ncbi:MAG: GIY-YIG nuclease family protein [Melioribacteraceae bacterium]|nr:GIY-YIG nuclease family protein [Melioribacteraceae bacterium]